jgi:hypothetical protein
VRTTRTLHRSLFTLAAVGLVLGLSSPANADFNIAVGLKWAPFRYTTAVGAGTDTSTGSAPVPGQWYNATGGDLYGNHWQTTSLDNYIGFFFTEQLGIQLSLDLGYANHNNDTGGNNNFSTSYFQFGFGLGFKAYFNRPTRERVSPYILLNFFKYFASVSTNDPGITNDIASAIASFHAPIGADIAFGAEYFFTTSFSLGAEVLGLRIAHVSGDVPGGNGNRINTGENYFTLYTAISLNYRFLATARVYTYEEEEDKTNPRPAPRRQRPRPQPTEPPPEQPPASPESVD